MDLRSIRDKVYDEIHLDILRGDLLQGQRISVGDFAERFNISPQPVRDAVIRLAEEGLLQVHPRRGTFVTTITAERIAEINAAREMMETFALERANMSGHPDAWQTIEESLLEMTTIRSRAQYNYLDYNAQDFRFHLATVMLSGNATITAMYSKLHPHYLYAMVMYNFATTSLGKHEDHARIVEMLKKGDFAAAATVAAMHTRKATDHLLALMQKPTATDRPGASA